MNTSDIIMLLYLYEYKKTGKHSEKLHTMSNTQRVKLQDVQLISTQGELTERGMTYIEKGLLATKMPERVTTWEYPSE